MPLGVERFEGPTIGEADCAYRHASPTMTGARTGDVGDEVKGMGDPRQRDQLLRALAQRAQGGTR